MIKKKYRIALLSYSLIESLITLLAFLAAYYLRSLFTHPVFGPLFPFRDYLGLLGVVLLLWMAIFFLIRKSQNSLLPDDPWKLIRETAVLVLTGSVLISALIFLLKMDFISRPFIAIFGVVNFICLAFFRIFARRSLHLFHNVLDGEHNLLVVGTNDKAGHIAEVLENAREWGYKIVGVIRTGSEDFTDPRLNRYPLIELGRVGEVVRNRVIDEMVFVVSLEELGKLEEVFLLCEEEGVKTRVMLSFFPHVTSKVYLEAIHELPLLTFTTTPQSEYLLFLKNALDFSLALFLILFLSPFLLGVALLIKILSGSPIIFRQVRCGLGGRKFVLYKFRTMIPSAEEIKEQLTHLNEMSGPVFKIREDPRCTPLGRLLRKFSIDELPQLFNIFKGDMSFVGPRPPLPQEVENYARWQRRRLRMKPGLTCLWQVSGRNKVDFEEWMRLDLEYIDNWSLMLDLMIFLKTIPVVLTARGAH